jgi:glycerol-3-phosphate dehydrogenase (NAD(P)+)
VSADVVGVLGAGGFGRGLARAASRNGREVILWSRTARDAPSPGIRTTTSLEDLARAGLLVVAVPSPHVATLARELGTHLDGRHLIVHTSRGLVGAELAPLTSVLRRETPSRRVGVLAGPLVADALEAGAPGGGIVGTRFPEVEDAVRHALAGPAFRIYSTRDVVGVEVAAAMVGLLALAAGYARGFGIGPAALGVVMTRGLAEAARVGALLGADERTFDGLAGIGDLLAAIAGDERPETRLGRALARGEPLDAAARSTGAHIEGVSIARRVAAFGARAGVDVPIAAALADVVDGTLSPEGAITRLMTRRAT